MNDDVRSLIPAWALDAVTDDERVAVEALLAADPEARAEADAMREAAAYLALADDQASEPVNSDVWNRIMEATGGEAGTSPQALAARLSVVPEAPVVLEPRRARRRPPRWTMALGAVAAAAAVFVVGVSLGRTQQPSVSQSAARWANAQAKGRTVVLSSNSSDLARIAVLPDGTAVVHNDALPVLPANKTYQLWAVLGDASSPTVISAGVLGPRIEDAPISFVGDPNAFVLTVEDAPGVAVSSQVATAAGKLA